MSEFKTSNKKCVIPNCYSRAKNAVSVQLFPFPTDRTMYKKWERQAGIEYGTHKRICQLHFNDGCFITNEENLDSKGKKKNILSLKKTAIPTTFNFGPPKTSRRLKVELSEIDIGPEMSEPLDAGEIEDEDDEEYNPPSKKIKKEKNEDEENTSPQKKDQKLPKPTRFSMMLDDSSIVVNTPDPKPKIKKEPMEKRGPKKKRGRPGRPKKGSFGPLSVQIKPKRKNEAQNESMDHDYHHPKTDYKLMSKQDLIDHIEQLEAKVATLSKENELYKKKDKETIWVSMNSMKKKPLQEKSTLWVSPQDYMDEIRQENQANSPIKKKQRQSTDTPFKCDQCVNCFSSKRNLLNHIEAVHEGKKPFVCANCNAKYSQKHSLILHIARKHGVKCSMCEDKFSSIQDLKKHFTRVHDGIEPTESELEAENIEAENSQDEMAGIEAENNEAEISAELSLNEEDTDITEDQILQQDEDEETQDTEQLLNEEIHTTEHTVLHHHDPTETTTRIVLSADQIETQEIILNPETTEVVIGNETYKVVVNSEDAENTEVVVTTLDPGSMH